MRKTSEFVGPCGGVRPLLQVATRTCPARRATDGRHSCTDCWTVLEGPCGGVAVALVGASCTSRRRRSRAGSDALRSDAHRSFDSIRASGGSGSLTVSAARDCTWAASKRRSGSCSPRPATARAKFDRVSGGGERRPEARRATIDVKAASADIVQELRRVVHRHAHVCDGRGVWRKCDYSGAAAAACTWTATTEATWIRIISGAAGQGDGGVAVAVEANTAVRVPPAWSLPRPMS